jgi:hypothetical protein
MLGILPFLPPFQGCIILNLLPRAHARGYILAPLRGSYRTGQLYSCPFRSVLAPLAAEQT